ncbi:MAG: Choline transport system permease protein OpuBB [Chlamydiia bacterium]|nr:Choline transport system permease protein OpuBB [Chlamydiia bacterium]
MQLGSTLSLVVEKSYEHLQLCVFSLLLAMLIAIPLGIVLADKRMQKLRVAIFGLIKVIQTIPGLAQIALVILCIHAISGWVHLPITGFFPATIVLVTYSLLPIMSNTVVGIEQVEGCFLEAAISMGMSRGQQLMWVQIPLALPLIISGVQTALAQLIGMATLTSLIGSGGLGDLILQGLKTMQINLILEGTVPCALFSVGFDGVFFLLSRFLLSPVQRTASI